MAVYTIGFTKKSAAEFFGALKRAGVKRLLDVRLSNASQLAGFTKKEDLAYFLQEILGAEYKHEPLLAPTRELLDGYKKQRGSWRDYEMAFLELMRQRGIESRLERSLLDGPTVLLCSEATAERCHRRLVLEYLRDRWGKFDIVHL
jgi:uncharacterized protein (DUF488 family)